LIFALALIVLGGGYYILKSMDLNGKKTEAEDTDIALTSVSAGDITNISWTYANENPSFTLSGGAWAYDADADFPAKQPALNDLAAKLTDIKASQAVAVADNLSDYGLDEPGLTLAFTAAGTTYNLAFGDVNPVSGEYYAVFNDDLTKVYAIGSELPEAFQIGLYDVLSFETIPDVTDVGVFTVTSENGTCSIVHLNDNGGLSYNSSYTRFFTLDGKEYKAADEAKVRDLVSDAADMVFIKCVDYKADDEALKSYGLDNPAVTVTLENYTDVGGNTGTISLEFGNYEGENCYVRIGGSRMVYLVKAEVEDKLALFSYEDIRPDDVCLMDWETVDSIDITLDERVYPVNIERVYAEKSDGTTGEASVTYTFSYFGTVLDASAGEAVLEAINGLKSTGSAEASIGRGEVISFTFHRNTATFKDMTLTLYKYDSTSDLVSFNGEMRLLVSADEVDKLVESVKALVGK
jgi:hypothetical protein